MMAASKAGRSLAMPVLTNLAGTMVAPPGSRAARAAGVVAQLVSGGMFAEAYRPVLEALPSSRPWRLGLAMGLLHGAGAGVLLALVPGVHPRVPEHVAPPGAFMLNHGAGPAVAFVGLHLLYGAVVASLLGSFRRLSNTGTNEKTRHSRWDSAASAKRGPEQLRPGGAEARRRHPEAVPATVHHAGGQATEW
jgi:hypothetical protein